MLSFMQKEPGIPGSFCVWFRIWEEVCKGIGLQSLYNLIIVLSLFRVFEYISINCIIFVYNGDQSSISGITTKKYKKEKIISIPCRMKSVVLRCNGTAKEIHLL